MELLYVLVKPDNVFSNNQITSNNEFMSNNEFIKYNESSIMFEPPKKLNQMFYRCDHNFYLDEILEMFDDEDNYGICLVSGEDLYVYIISVCGSQNEIKLINKKTIELETRTRRGGSSSARYGRINDKAKNFNKTTFAEIIVNSYMFENHTKCRIKKLIIAGPTDMKKDITETPLFQQHLQKYLFKLINTNGIGLSTVNEILDNILLEIKYSNVKDVDDEINNLIKTNYENLIIGNFECSQFIENKNIIKLFVCKSSQHEDIAVVQMLDNLKINCPTVNIIYSESSMLKTYGGWLGIKKY